MGINQFLAIGGKSSHRLSKKMPDRWKPANVNHYPAGFGSHKHCGMVDVLRKFLYLTVVAIEMGKGRYISYHNHSCTEDKILIKIKNLVHSDYHS